MAKRRPTPRHPPQLPNDNRMTIHAPLVGGQNASKPPEKPKKERLKHVPAIRIQNSKSGPRCGTKKTSLGENPKRSGFLKNMFHLKQRPTGQPVHSAAKPTKSTTMEKSFCALLFYQARSSSARTCPFSICSAVKFFSRAETISLNTSIPFAFAKRNQA